jgi:hypothetical protein
LKNDISPVPLGNKSLFAASLFHHGSIFRLKETLPADVKTIGEVANVHQSDFLKLLSYCRIKLLIHLAAINHGRTPTLLCRDHAEEADAAWPRVHV